jgi:acetyl esterase/lipase
MNPDTSSFYGREDFVGRTVEDKKKASAIYLLKDKPVDTYLYHGSEDITIDVNQSYRLAKAITQKGGNASVLAYEGVGHSFFEKEPYLSVTTRATNSLIFRVINFRLRSLQFRLNLRSLENGIKKTNQSGRLNSCQISRCIIMINIYLGAKHMGTTM